MAGYLKRARTEERDRTLEILADAFARGDLTLEEHSKRVDRALRNKTVGGLQGIVDDLGGVVAPGLAGTSAMEPASKAAQKNADKAGQKVAKLPRPRPRWFPSNKALAVAGVVLVCGGIITGLVVEELNSTETPTLPVAEPLDASLLREVRAAVEEKFPGGVVFNVRISDLQTLVDVPVEPTGRRYQTWVYEEGRWRASDQVGTASVDRFTLSTLPDEVALDALAEARASATSDEYESWELALIPDNDTDLVSCVSARVGAGDSDDVLIWRTCDGKPLDPVD